MLIAVWLLMVVGRFWAKMEENVEVRREECIVLGKHRERFEHAKGRVRGVEKRSLLRDEAGV